MKKRNEAKYMQYLKRNKNRGAAFWILILLIAVITVGILYVDYIQELTYEHIYNNIRELSEQTATQLNLVITDQKNFINIMVDSINRGYFNSPKDIIDRYKGDLADYHFTRLVILDKNGNGTTSDGYTVKNYSDIDIFFNSGKNVVLLENRPSTVFENKQVNTYSRTFKLNGEELVLMATINTENYKDILLRRLFGEGGTYLINNDGKVLIDSFDTIKENNTNWFEYFKKEHNINEKDRQKINDIAKSIKGHEEGTIDIKVNGERYFIHYEKIDINDWYILTTAANRTIGKELIELVAMTFALCTFVAAGIISISIYINVSNQKKSQRLYEVAYIDPITGLGNEAYFKENGAVYLNNAGKNRYIIALDINKFKALNNIYGYEFCDHILRTVGEELLKLLPEDNVTGRISNDIFATLFSYDKDIDKLLDKIFYKASTLKVDGIDIHVNLSIGVYKIHKDDKDINKALDKAYIARAKIKGLYDDNYYIFDDVLENKIVEEQQIESCMEEALRNHEFKVVYQPKTFTKTERVTGAEALVRWIRNGEVISPDKFIPLFERNKFIIKLDLYIFEQVCKDIASWKEKYNYVPIVSINVSKEHFSNENFVDEYVEITDKYHIDRSSIDLEITESATIDTHIDVLAIFHKIKEKGFIISIDDFGTGYSSLSMLQSMPIDIIKIDKVFVDKADLQSDRNIINYIMLIAKRLGVKTIVEGVETKEQVEFVRQLKCDVIQGYYYSKPIFREEFEEYFNKNK